MTDVLQGTLQELAKQVEELNIKISVMVCYDYDAETWVVVAADSTTGKLKVDTT